MRVRPLTVIAVAAFLSASCSQAEPTDSLAPGASVKADESVQPGAAVVPDGSECPPVRILSPSGNGTGCAEMVVVEELDPTP